MLQLSLIVYILALLLTPFFIIQIFAEETTCVHGIPINLQYAIKGGTIKSICALPTSWQLLITIDSNSDGQFTIKIPRNILDAKSYNCDDDSFVVLVDGAEISYAEEKNSRSRTMTIQFEEGNSQIEIIVSNTIESAPFLGCLADPPKQQILAGKSPLEIICNNGFVLTRKISNGSIACVTPSTLEKLIERVGQNQSNLQKIRVVAF